MFIAERLSKLLSLVPGEGFVKCLTGGIFVVIPQNASFLWQQPIVVLLLVLALAV